MENLSFRSIKELSEEWDDARYRVAVYRSSDFMLSGDCTVDSLDSFIKENNNNIDIAEMVVAIMVDRAMGYSKLVAQEIAP